MKTINSLEDGDFSIEDLLNDKDDKFPCWYADFDNKNKEWKVGVKHNTKAEEITVLESSIKNYNLNSLELAVKLIDLYRAGGRKRIKEWLNV